MLFKAPVSSISNWKFQFSSNMISKNSIILQSPNPVQPLIASFQIKNQSQFNRFFTKQSTTTKPEEIIQSEQEIIQQATSLLDGTNGQSKDPIKAASLLKKLADNGSTQAMIMYAGMAENGIGLPTKDIETAGNYYRKAAEQDSSTESCMIYLQFLRGQKKEADLQSYTKKIVEEGNGSRLYVLALFSLHEGNRNDCEKYLNLAIDREDVDSMILLASLSISKDPETSLKLLKRAIGKGSIVAMYGYASYLAKGEFESIKENRENEAFSYMKRAADGGLKDALVTLGEWYLNGFCCVRNVEKSFEYFKKAADLFDDPYSQFIYGSFLLSHEKCDKKIGFDYVKKAAQQNLPDALFKLGFCFMSGNGVNKNEMVANKFLKLAADSENADGEMLLNYAVRLLVGEKIKKDENEAAKYLKRGAESGNKLCIQFLKDLKVKI